MAKFWSGASRESRNTIKTKTAAVKPKPIILLRIVEFSAIELEAAKCVSHTRTWRGITHHLIELPMRQEGLFG